MVSVKAAGRKVIASTWKGASVKDLYNPSLKKAGKELLGSRMAVYRTKEGGYSLKRKSGRTSEKDPVASRLNRYYAAAVDPKAIEYVYAEKSRTLRSNKELTAVRLKGGAKGWVTSEGNFIGEKVLRDNLHAIDSTLVSAINGVSLLDMYDALPPSKKVEFAEKYGTVDWKRFWDEMYPNQGEEPSLDRQMDLYMEVFMTLGEMLDLRSRRSGVDDMPLWTEEFALDTESDRYTDGKRKTRLVQACPISASSLKEVRVWYGWDAWNDFFDTFEETQSRKKLRCHCYNLGGYEWVGMLRDALQNRYVFTENKSPSKGEWNWVADEKTVYRITVRNGYGTIIDFTDDLRRVGGASMKTIAQSVRNQHPDWFPMEEVKEETDYHDGWLDMDDTDFEKSMHYSKVDAFSQAMISRYLVANGYSMKLTAPATGLQVGLSIRYGNGPDLTKSDARKLRFNEADFVKHYPPLTEEMQEIAENSIMGGFVWGATGHWHGTFTHLDYSSSYPAEYAYGRMFIGKVRRLFPNDAMFRRLMHSDRVMKWVLVSFDFRLKEGMLGCISGKECVSEDDPMIGRMNKKMKEGHVSRRLYTSTYLEEVGRHYDLSNVEYHELWVAKPKTGDFEPMIRELYMRKNRLKEEGKDDTADYRLTKLFLNGGVHGKTITRTDRRKRIWNQEERKVEYVREKTEPRLNFLIGFTAMQNGRERLLRHCRMLIEAGYHIMMCDTDSIVTDTTPEKVREVIGDWFCHGHEMETNLGRFDIENDRKGLKRAVKEGKLTQEQADELGVSETFDEFKCWGLKRYAEIRNTEYGRMFRKAAFAGMFDEEQENLMDVPVDREYEYEWVQKGKKTEEHCVSIVDVTKHMKAENIWDEGRIEAGAPRKGDLRRAAEVYETMRKRMETVGIRGDGLI